MSKRRSVPTYLFASLLGFVVLSFSASAQSTAANEWTWMGGSGTVGSNGGQPGVYGTLGMPASGNIPGGREYATSWTDGSGNFWLFGGIGYDAKGLGELQLNDLWEFNPSTNAWT
jgi:hypothetical protein